MPITVLPHQVAARIAAGEVVERPASAVKELVENALDAGASAVRVEVQAGGVDGLRVIDNGCGIPAGDVACLFQRHATSKLTDEADLTGIATLGFRGEALYSLAAVARVRLLTRTADADAAVHVEADNGRVVKQSPQGGPVGTTVEIAGLFEELPARRKFLRSPKAELARIHAVVTSYALSHPDVRFTLAADGKTTFTTPGGDLREAAAAVFGHEAAAAFLEVDGAPGLPVGVHGLTSPLSMTRGNRSGIALFVNGRPIQSRTLTFAAAEAYHGLLPADRYPVAVLMVQAPPEDVDVNVHPTKAEVRFRNEGDVFRGVQRAVREAVVASAPAPEIALTAAPGAPAPIFAHAGAPTLPGDASLSPADVTAPPPPTGDAVTQPGLPVAPGVDALPPLPTSPPHGQGGLPLVDALPALRVLGQVQETYIVAEGPDGLYLIDQHAAHECVVYDRLRAAADRSVPETQGLLEPATVALTLSQDELAHDNAELLARYGWLLEPFGERTRLLRGVPAVLAGRDPAKSFLDVLDSASAAAEFTTWEERIAATVACHGSVRAGQSLSREEMVEMVRLLERVRQPHTCPHGRPTMLHLSANNLEREFGRR